MLQAHLILALLWFLFCVVHSVLASLRVKEVLQKKLGAAFRYYRIFYTLFAFASLLLVVGYQVQLASPLVFRSTPFTLAAGGLVALSGLVIMAICIRKYFLSLSGLKSLFQQQPAATLMISGIHRFVRHPLYLGTFLAIWGFFLLLPLWSMVVSHLIITGYTLIGIELEEKKLEAEFGNDYARYRQEVPKLVPRRLKRV